jgi:hypothetical protein
MELERNQEQLITNEQGFVTLIARVREAITELDQRAVDIKSKERTTVLADVQQTQNDLDDVDNKVKANRTLRSADSTVEAHTFKSSDPRAERPIVRRRHGHPSVDWRCMNCHARRRRSNTRTA